MLSISQIMKAVKAHLHVQHKLGPKSKNKFQTIVHKILHKIPRTDQGRYCRERQNLFWKHLWRKKIVMLCRTDLIYNQKCAAQCNHHLKGPPICPICQKQARQHLPHAVRLQSPTILNVIINNRHNVAGRIIKSVRQFRAWLQCG